MVARVAQALPLHPGGGTEPQYYLENIMPGARSQSPKATFGMIPLTRNFQNKQIYRVRK